MDFGAILSVAQQKTQNAKNGVRFYSTKFEPPKKEERAKTLSVNIQKFLARKEAEEKQKLEEAKIKKLELLALRAQDSKAKRRVQVMLKRTKSANKSVIDDAIDNKNTAITLAGPSQPDEDDYGYESQEAAAYYAKMMERYNNMPEEEKFPGSKKRSVSTNLASTKDRVKAALLREEEEAALPHKRKRRTKTAIEESREGNERPEPYSTSSSSLKPEPEKEKPKPKRMAPPPIDFNQLLKIAEKKQFEPIKIEPKKVEIEEPLMTKKQKKEMEKEKAWRDSREARLRAALTAPRTNPKISEKSSSNSSLPQKPSRPNISDLKIAKINSNSNQDCKISKTPNNSDNKKAHSTLTSMNRRIPKLNGSSGSKPTPQASSNSTRPDIKTDRNRKPEFVNRPNGLSQTSRKSELIGESKRPDYGKPSNRMPGTSSKVATSSSSGNIRKPESSISQPPNRSSLANSKNLKMKQGPGDNKPKQFPPSDVRPRQFPPSDTRPKQFPPTDIRPKQFPPADVRPKQFPPGDVRRRPAPKDIKRKQQLMKRRIIDDDSEYDSELEDFIDDTPIGEGEDYSKHISEIFGYDKSRYRDVDEDDAAMESNYSNILKEEYISAKMGMMEDLEDMKKEQEDKKRKALMKKRR